VEIATFRALFEPNTRAALNWDRLCAEAATVSVAALICREDLGSLLTVWAVSPSGSQGNLRNPEDTPLALCEAAPLAENWPPTWARIQQFRADMLAGVRGDEPLLLTLPVYAVGDRRAILDSTHRAVAAYLTGLEVRVVVLAVHGPLDNGVLPYLDRLVAAAA
jgi:hypothetical protein